MREKTIKDVITIENGLFQYINYTIDTFTNSELDFMFISKYGNRIISPIIESLLNDNYELTTDKLTLLGQIINKMFAYNWDKQKEILLNEYNPLDNYHETIEISKENENNNTTNTDNKTFAYNSETSVDKDNTNQTSLGGFTENTTQIKSGLTNGNYKDIIEKALDAKALRFIDIVFNDIKWFISLDIYR